MKTTNNAQATKRFPSPEFNSDEAYCSPTEGLKVKAVPEISFVIPVRNDAKSLEQLVSQIAKHAGTENYEIVLIDDGSTDGTWAVMKHLVDLGSARIRAFRFWNYRGKAAGLQTGCDAAQGELIFTMDADLQDDLAAIPHFIARIHEGYDLVSGNKAVQHNRRNQLQNHSCSFKCYRREVAKSVKLFGELQSVVAAKQGFKVHEIVAQHRAGQFDVLKHSIERSIRSFSDMLTRDFLQVYRERPSHFTNFCATGYAAIAVCMVATAMTAGVGTLGGIASLLVAMTFFGIGGACIIAGLLIELVIRQNNPVQVHPIAGAKRNAVQSSNRGTQRVDTSGEFDLLPPASFSDRQRILASA